MKLIYSFFSLLFLLFCSGCSDDIEVAKQESLLVFLTQETSTYRTKENAIIEVERFIKKDKSATRTGSSLNYSIGWTLIYNNQAVYGSASILASFAWTVSIDSFFCSI
mgnify:CR=1 FL=1